MFGLGFGLKYWMNSYLGGAVSSAISWLLPFNLNLSATVGDDAVMAVGSDTTARVWDETDGLVLATVSAGNPVSEGMRLATTVADGAELGVEILPALSLGGWTDTDPNGEIVGDTVVYTGSTAGTAGIYYVNPPVVVGEKYIVSCTVAGFSGSGILRLQIGNQLSSPNITADGRAACI